MTERVGGFLKSVNSKFILRAALFILLFASLAFAPGPASPADRVEAARLNNLGAAYMNQQLFEKGLKAFQRAARLDPQLETAKLNQGIALLNLGRVDEAKPILEDAFQRTPNDPNILYNVGLLYKNSDNSAGAIDAFRHVTQIDPDDADSWYFLGTVYSQSKQFPLAIEAFHHALKVNPLHASAEFGLSRAYQQSGDTDLARENLQRFQHITQAKLGSPISLAYGEQGKYSRAEESAAFVEKGPEQIPVKFVDVTAEAGLVGKSVAHGGDDDLAPGACFLDYDNDGKPDLFLPDNGTEGGMSLYHNLGNGRFEDVTNRAGLDSLAHGSACTAGDYDNDGATDLAVVSGQRILLMHNEKKGSFKDVTATAGIQELHGITSLTFLDYDHDGDLDLYGSGSMAVLGRLSSSGSSVMWRNNGDGTFTNVTSDIGVSIDGLASNAIGTDYNNDRAVDIAVADTSSGTIFQNPREGKFVVSHPFFESPSRDKAPVGVFALDFNHDGWMDIALSHRGKDSLKLWRNNKHGSFDLVELPVNNLARAWGVAAFDYDNDGWVDLVAVGEDKNGRGEVKLFRNLGPDGWKDVSADVGLDKIELKSPRAIITGDYDSDGATDLLITQNHGPAVLLRNVGGNKNNFLRLNLKGLNDNKSAIGTKIEVFADGNRQKFELAGSSGYLGQNSLIINVGLGKAKQADVVRMLWPTGVLQDETEVAANHEQAYLEIDRRGSSCPTLFAWDGKHYELIADTIGAGVVGHWIAPGERNIPRPTEYIKVSGDQVRQKDGKLSFRFMEPMEEVVYLDQVGLLAVDHPANVDVYPNEYFASNPPYPEFKTVISRNARPPAGAWDEHGHDLLPDLRAHKYVGDFAVLPFKGFTKPHTVELDLGAPYTGGPLWLLMHGEIEYFMATSMYAASQAGVAPVAPYLEALDANGKRVRVLDDMGFPAGGPRTMTVDLSGRLPNGTQKIRFTTNLQIYWDSILIDRAPQDSAVNLTSVPLQSATLSFHGYPRQSEAQPPGVMKYVYEDVSRTGPYARQAGTYTRYGDVLPLLTAADDRSVVFGSGEEVALEFDAKGLPTLPKGWTRDYFFMVQGYEKDMDFYAAESNTVEPLPFRAMGSYPSSKPFPMDARHLEYLLEYNTRQVSGNEPSGYSYGYKLDH